MRNQITQTKFTSLIVEMAFGLLSVVMITGTRPFETSGIQEVAQSSRGSFLEVTLFLVPTISIIFASLWILRKSIFSKYFLLLLLLVFYCGISILWAISPFQAMIRFMLFVLVTFSIAMACNVTPPERIVRIITVVLAVVICIDIISVFTIFHAVHRTDGVTEKLFGAWKGIHIHKNHAGPVASIALILFVLLFLRKRNTVYFLLVGLSLSFLIMTESRSSIYSAALCLVVLLMMKVARRLFSSVSIFIIAFNLANVIIIATLLNIDSINQFLSDGKNITGRTEVWNILIEYVRQHPLTGSGFGSFWRIGFESPMLRLTDGWGIATGQGHNGYLDVAVTLGIPGLTLTVFVLLIAPVWKLIMLKDLNRLEYDFAFCIIVFAIIHNFTESSLLAARHSVFFFLLLGISIVAKLAKDPVT